MFERELVYTIENADWHLVLSSGVLCHMARYKQVRYGMKEAGGQLYAPSLTSEIIDVSTATGPYTGDKRRRSRYSMQGDLASLDRLQQFNVGNHLCGLWHTHPENKPTPSHMDVEAIQKNLEILPQWTSLLLIIQGALEGRVGLYVGIYNQDSGLVQMLPKT